jgi:two-component system, OmpR family, phosphate regulon sensor histidine kinase PhoR
MRRNRINLVIVLAVVSLTAIVAGQVYWVKQAFTIQERQFNDRVIIALNDVVEEIMAMNNDSSMIEPVYQKESNFFIANITETPEPYLLEDLLLDKFTQLSLNEVFEYGIYDCYTDSIVYGSRLTPEAPYHKEDAAGLRHSYHFEKDGHYFGVYFPNKSGTILLQLDFWLYSSILLLVIVIFFTYTIYLLFRQKRLSEVKTDFINNMTHEFKTPISTIALSTEILNKDEVQKDPGRLRQYIQIIRQENNRLKSQVDKVLQIATLSPKQISIQQTPVNMHVLLTRIADTFKLQIEEQGGKLQLQLEAGAHTIGGDEVHLTNIVFNLLDNALKYSEPPAVIEISTRNVGREFELSIKDHGIGIPKNQQKMIFDKFYRVPKGDQHDVKGFGLGLFYVKSIVKAHSGSIHVTSEPGQGSTFSIRIKTISK